MRHPAWLTLAAWLLLAVTVSPLSWAAKYDEVLEGVIRASQKAERLPRGQRLLRPPRELPKLPGPVRSEEELLRRFNRLEHVDDSLRTQFRALPAAERAVVVELGEAAQKVLRKRGDQALELLRRLDTDGLVQLRTYGDFVGDGVLLMGPEYKLVVRKTGSAAGKFYQDWVAPHTGKWLAAGLIAAYLAAPESFHDAAGNLTEYGARKLTETGIDVGARASQGFWQGMQNRFRAEPLYSSLGVALIVVCGLLCVPRFRWLLRRCLWPLLAAPAERPAASSPSAASPASPQNPHASPAEDANGSSATAAASVNPRRPAGPAPFKE